MNGGGLKKLFLVTRSMKAGGCERVVAQLANRFAGAGIETWLFTEYRHDSFYPLDARIRECPLLEADSCSARDICKIFLSLRRYVLREKPDAVLAMPDMVNVWTALFLAGTGIPVIVSERNDPARFPPGKIRRFLRKPAYRRAKGFVFQTEQQKNYYSGRIRRIGKVIPNPLDTDSMPEPYFGERRNTVVTAARLVPQKNLSLLLSAFGIFYREHPDWKLIIYGEGPERPELERIAVEFPEGTVLLPGENRNLTETIRTDGVFVLSSDYEGMPNALIEAMALGLPCVSTDCPAGGPAALIRNGENGILVGTGDEQELAAAIGRIANDGAAAMRLGKNAAQIRETLNGAAVTAQWLDYIKWIALGKNETDSGTRKPHGREE